MSDTPRAVFLGLRSNVHFFASQRGFLQLDTRIKTLALVYDTLVFEDGVYDANIGEGGSFRLVSPYQDESQLKPVRTRRGQPFGVRAALTGTDDYHTVIATTSVKAYRSQFISTLQQLAPLRPDWARTVDGVATEWASAADTVARDWKWKDGDLLRDILPDEHHFFRDALIDHLYTDLARAYVFGMDLAPDGVHATLLRRKAADARLHDAASGVRTLGLLLPAVHRASWHDIADLRKDRGLANLRAKLREHDAAGGSDVDRLRRITEEYAADVEKYQPRWRNVGITIGWNILSAIPFVSIPAGVAQTGVSIGQVVRAKNHWTATLMRVRRRTSA